MPTLYLVGTPIGNLEDISLRALRILAEVDLIAAEDTRTTGRLLKKYDIDTPMISYHEYSSVGRVAKLVRTLETADVALVSEAGMPGLSDPGYRLVQGAIAAGLKVVPIPGPSAVTTALIASGLPTDKFLFLGFAPRQQTARLSALSEVASLPYTIVFYESPHRLLAFLADLEQVFGDRRLSVGRELTKMHEEIWIGSISEAIVYFDQTKIKGEFTLVVEGAQNDALRWSEAEVRSAITAALAEGVRRKEAVARIAEESGWPKRDIYELSLREE